jgi:hypothetical protein
MWTGKTPGTFLVTDFQDVSYGKNAKSETWFLRVTDFRPIQPVFHSHGLSV